MKSDLSTLDELNRREFIASAAKACLGVGLLPMAGSFVHNSISALEPGSRPASAICHLSQHDRGYVSFGHLRH